MASHDHQHEDGRMPCLTCQATFLDEEPFFLCPRCSGAYHVQCAGMNIYGKAVPPPAHMPHVVLGVDYYALRYYDDPYVYDRLLNIYENTRIPLTENEGTQGSFRLFLCNLIKERKFAITQCQEMARQVEEITRKYESIRQLSSHLVDGVNVLLDRQNQREYATWTLDQELRRMGY